MASMRGIPELLCDQHRKYHGMKNVLFLLEIFSGDAGCIAGYIVQFVDLEFEYFIIPINCRLDQMGSNDVAFITPERVIDNEHLDPSEGVAGV